MRTALLLLLICSFGAVPFMAEAAVTISEVAWMGDDSSANHEWIELHNDGDTTSIEGWVLTDGVNLSIALAGMVPAGAYVVLERTSDESAPGAAFFIYTGALVNTGATLRLLRADGGIEDQVAGGTDWENIGGDNVTKETAQLTLSGWVTAVPTPGSANTTERAETDGEVVAVSETSTVSSVATTRVVTSSKTVGPPKLHSEPSVPAVTVTGPTTVMVGQPVSYEAAVTDIGPTIARSMTYVWNFGDTATTTGKEVTHTYAYPGEYTMVVQAAYKDYVAESAVPVVVLPYAFSLSLGSDGLLRLHNDARYRVAIAGVRLSARSGTYTFPSQSYMEPGATIVLPSKLLSYVSGEVRVFDPLGHVVGSYGTVSVPTVASVASAVQYEPVTPVSVSTPFSFADETAVAVVPTPTDPVTALESTVVPEMAETKPQYPPFMIYGAWMLVVLVGVLAVTLKRQEPAMAYAPRMREDDEIVPFR